MLNVNIKHREKNNQNSHHPWIVLIFFIDTTSILWWRDDMERISTLLDLFQGNHRWTIDSLREGPIMRSFGSVVARLNKLLKTQASCQWFENLWHSRGATLWWSPFEYRFNADGLDKYVFVIAGVIQSKTTVNWICVPVTFERIMTYRRRF